jgi:hypothetical protein
VPYDHAQRRVIEVQKPKALVAQGVRVGAEPKQNPLIRKILAAF